ncbi:MAG: hypothetical protein Q9160_001519 [Pyrenula sp. 1 TL-2023]
MVDRDDDMIERDQEEEETEQKIINEGPSPTPPAQALSEAMLPGDAFIKDEEIKSEDTLSQGVKSEDTLSQGVKSEDTLSQGVKSEDAKSEDTLSQGVKIEDTLSQGIQAVQSEDELSPAWSLSAWPSLFSPPKTPSPSPQASENLSSLSSPVPISNEKQRANYNIYKEYKVWKKNAHFLYDVIISTALDWPTLTTQWLPDVQAPGTHPSGSAPDKDYTTHRVLIGTHTEGGAPNYLQIATVTLPTRKPPKAEDYDEETGEIGGYGRTKGKAQASNIKFSIVQKIDHPGEVNKARYSQKNPNIIATHCTDGTVAIWDRTKHSSIPTGLISPQIQLTGHTAEGFGLAWSPHHEQMLVSGSEDKTVRVWDLSQYSKSSKQLSASRVYTHHASVVNDVEYHPFHKDLIGTVSDDLTMSILDTRSPKDEAQVSAVNGHRDAINAIAFNPKVETVIATGSADCTIAIWDLRNLKNKLHTCEGHKDHVTSLEWSPHDESILGSASYDRRICFWDLSRVGEEQTPEDAEDGAPELLFMHGGHTNRISDFSWNKNEPWVLISAAEDNLVQCWKPSEAIVHRDTEDVPTDELEQ